MTQKEEQILREIMTFYKENKVMPTIRYLQKKMNYKSSNSISQYFNSLEKKNYLTRNKNNKLILTNESFNYEKGLKLIKILNSKETVSIILNKEKRYIGYILKNNYFQNKGLYKGDILIIEVSKKIKNNQLGLFIINKKYRIMEYFYKDGFYILKDNEEIILNKIKLIGKVIMIQRKI